MSWVILCASGTSMDMNECICGAEPTYPCDEGATAPHYDFKGKAKEKATHSCAYHTGVRMCQS